MMARPARFALLLCVSMTACGDKPADYFPGYAEAEYLRLAAPIAGTLVKVQVRRGDTAQAGAPAFILEQENERAAQAEATFRAERARAQLADLRKGKRPDEIAAVQAQLNQAAAALQLSTSNLSRQKQLVADKFIAPSIADEARAAVKRDQARVNELQSQLRIAQTGARSDEIAAAEQEWKAAEAQLAQAEWKLAQKTQRIPLTATVDDVLFREGEFVQAGSPIVSLLPPQNIKLRFFVAEPVLGRLAVGQALSVRCDGCRSAIAASVSYVSSSPEYTSPLIYSKENRATLVFMIEARPAPEQATLLHPGQPVEVRLANAPSTP